MKKERNMAIIEIVLTNISFWIMIITYGFSSKIIQQTVFPVGAEYEETLQNWVKASIFIYIHFFYQLFYYVTYLTDGVKSKIKSLVNFSIIGLVLSTGLLISGISLAGVSFSLIHTPYSIIFSIIMLVRSFRKSKAMNKA